MEIEYLDEITEIGEAFINRFVLPWESFRIKHKDWIDKMGEQHHPIDRQWYDQAYLWDKMDPSYPGVSMEEALERLRGHCGTVLFMSEKSERGSLQGTKTIDYVAKADSDQLADRIEFEWYESYRLIEQHRFIPDALPGDLYVFDPSMKWCIVFAHETTDWEAETADDWMKAAQSRYCIICEE